MRNRRVAGAGVFVALALGGVGCTGAGVTSNTESTDRVSIRAAGDAFLQLYSDPDAAIEYFTDDGVLIPPGVAPVVGRVALLDHLRAGSAIGDWDQSVERDSIFVRGDLGVERGRYRVALQGADFVATGHYLIHWQRTDTGWRMATYMGSADP